MSVLQQIKRLPYITARKVDGEYRITITGLTPARAEAVACYTDDDEDAIGSAQDMSLRECRRRQAAGEVRS